MTRPNFFGVMSEVDASGTGEVYNKTVLTRNSRIRFQFLICIEHLWPGARIRLHIKLTDAILEGLNVLYAYYCLLHNTAWRRMVVESLYKKD